MSTIDPVLQQLYIIRAQLNLLIASLEPQVTPGSSPEACQHPQEKRIQAHNMGEEPYFLCTACGQEVAGMA